MKVRLFTLLRELLSRLRYRGFSDETVAPGSQQDPPARFEDVPEPSVAEEQPATGDSLNEPLPAKYAELVLDDRPIAWWRLGERDTGPARDSSGHGNDGHYFHVTLGVTGAIAGDPDTAGRFNGETSRLITPEALNQLVNDFSVEAWFRNYNAGRNHVNAQIMGSPNIFDARFNFGCWHDNTWKLTKYTVEDIFVAAVVEDTNWHHVVLVYSSSEGVLLYLDGMLVGRHPSTSDLNTDRPFPPVGMGENGHHHGDLDEIAVYGYVLPPARVEAHYRKGRYG